MEYLRITEIFYSIQGESSTIGMPTTFVRLTGCPLRCTYCDSEYAFTGGELMSLLDIAARVSEQPTRHVTVTGGEPLAQKNCSRLLEELIDRGFRVSLETSGAMDLAPVDPRVVKVMDLKTPSSGEQHQNLYSNLEYLDRQDQIKFVIGSQEDYSWACDMVRKLGLEERCQILFSPVFGQMDATCLADNILRDGIQVRLQVQLHKLLWGDVAGK